MKRNFTLMCCVIVSTFIISMTCVPAMAYQLSNVISTQTDTETYVVSSEESNDVESYNTDTTVVNTDEIPSYTESSEITTSDYPELSDTDVLPSTDTESDVIPSDTNSEVISSEESSKTESVVSIDDSDDYYEEESHQPHYVDSTVYNTPLYSTVEETTRSVITKDTWSNISLDTKNSNAAGKINMNNGGKGDFSFIKDNNPNNGKSTLYYWLAGGIACIAVGLCGTAFVIITTLDNKKRLKAAARAKGKRSFSRGDTAEINIPKNRRR